MSKMFEACITSTAQANGIQAQPNIQTEEDTEIGLP